MLASKPVLFKAPKSSRSYAGKPPASNSSVASSVSSAPDISGLLSLKLKYGDKAPPQIEHTNELKKYFATIGLKNYIKKVQNERANDPYKLELAKYNKTNPSEYNSQEKLAKLFPLIAKKNPWPTDDEARVKGAAIFGVKETENPADIPLPNLWDQWQKDKLALYDAIQDALDATDDASTEVDSPFFANYPPDRPLSKEDLALLSPELRDFSVNKNPSFPHESKLDPFEEFEVQKYVADRVSRELEVVAGELYNSPNPSTINPFEEEEKK
jgi:hypothetical protein